MNVILEDIFSLTNKFAIPILRLYGLPSGSTRTNLPRLCIRFRAFYFLVFSNYYRQFYFLVFPNYYRQILVVGELGLE